MTTHRATLAPALALALVALGSTAAARGQTIDYNLPTSSPKPTPKPGPSDTQPAPATSPAATPAATAPPSPTPAPTPRPSASPTTPVSVPRPVHPIVRPQPVKPHPAALRIPSSPLPKPSVATPVPVPTPTPLPSVAPSVATPVPTSPAPSPSPPAPAASAEPSGIDNWWKPAAGGVALLGAGFGAWLLRRRRPALPDVPAEPAPVALEPTPPPPAEPAPTPYPEASPSAPAPAPAPLEIAFAPVVLHATLVAVTLGYRLRLTNTGAEPLDTLAIEGDLVSAHATLPPEQQIAAPGTPLELRHAAVRLAPGESAEFGGDLRLPLTRITPIKGGGGTFLVPLVRLRIEAARAGGARLIVAQTFVIGEIGETPAAPLRPFRLDLGPRTYNRVGQRAVVLGRRILPQREYEIGADRLFQ